MAYIGRVPSVVPLETGDIPANSIDSSKIIDGVITIADIGANAVGSSEIVNNAVTTVKVLDANVTTAKIADDAVTTDKLANSINAAISANTSKTSNATHSGEVTGSGTLTIANDAVTTAKLNLISTSSVPSIEAVSYTHLTLPTIYSV